MEPTRSILESASPGLGRRQFLLGAASASAGLWLLSAGAAEAATYKTVTGTPVRNGPSIRSTQVATFASGTSVNIGSQTVGSRLGSGSRPNNATWCRLTDGRWIHDMHLNTPGNAGTTALSDGLGGYATWSAGVQRTSASILGRNTRDAVAWWAETQLGVSSYDGWCYAFSVDAWRYGAGIDPGTAPTAIGKWNSLPASARNAPSSAPPRGALVFWNWSNQGHVAVSAGNGNVVSSYYGPTHAISWTNISNVTNNTGKQLGWWLPA